MARPAKVLLVGLVFAILAWWLAHLGVENGVDQLLYHRMADSIVLNGRAAWIVHPLSYLGIFPGSDSPAAVFLVAEFASVSGMPVSFGILAYDALLIVVFLLGLFMLTRVLTHRTEAALLAVLLGGLSYGFLTSVSWSLDERSFNVALTPVFVFALVPRSLGSATQARLNKVVYLGLVSFVMLYTHFSFLLLVPIVVLIPVVCRAVLRQWAARRTRVASPLFFGLIGMFPLLLLAILTETGTLERLGLGYPLETSALLSGSSPIVLFLNSLVFLGTRAGPVILTAGVLGLAYLAIQPSLREPRVTLGAALLGIFVGIPVVLYSKDLITPILVVLASIFLVGVGFRLRRLRLGAWALVGAIVIAGSVSFDEWNFARESRNVLLTYWTVPGVTPEADAASAWLQLLNARSSCVYGNNWLAVRQVTADAFQLVCGDTATDSLIQLELQGTNATPVGFTFNGLLHLAPGDWFESPQLDAIGQDFARLPQLDYAVGRTLLAHYNVRFIVVALQKPTQVPGFLFQGAYDSLFFTQLWQFAYPLYQTQNFAIFQV